MRLGFLASHGGSNMQAILDACASGAIAATPTILICNNPGAPALERATKAGLTAEVLNNTTHPLFEELDDAITQALSISRVDLVILAGYMKHVGPRVLSAFQNRILNVHPALLPKYGGQGMFGMNVHRAVIENGEKESGATVHLVNEIYDEGPILAQAKVPVFPVDTPETLRKRVLEQEHRLYPETIAKIVNGEIKLP
ncbi:phosphoribosylglycinamide formyltransferase [Pelagicoccus sp. SDUM812003]|uniref:phosphoribosylglycinamide formyltransferase n=1 Tax=Pelagicoccus sp. SDUM812003 TaxID=3041267 RepID=UPI0028103419|nr:phosphoribosylglycinamide formyltransferase [Pelagicoccus sp. SDUM812003]MDQ8201721.1 phosphoribosylglycinamide formyltransferase [Pelagicoccus sp. SDUM812003]